MARSRAPSATAIAASASGCSTTARGASRDPIGSRERRPGGRCSSRPSATRSDMRNVRQAGWEYVEEFDVLAHARTFARDVEAVLAAKPAVEKPTTLLIDQPFLALLVHESCGHPTESDRVLEHEVAFAGTTFMWPKDRGTLRYGSAVVNLTADAAIPGGVGTFGWGDDGGPAARAPLVRRGSLTR